MILDFNRQTTAEQMRQAARQTNIDWGEDTIPVRKIAGRKREYPTLPNDADTDDLIDSIEDVVNERPDVINQS